jgi:hypothetical protein
VFGQRRRGQSARRPTTRTATPSATLRTSIRGLGRNMTSFLFLLCNKIMFSLFQILLY